MSRLIRLEWHPLGPRVYLFGVRVHEWHLGLGFLTLAMILWGSGLVDRGLLLYVLVAVGVWAVVKDWRDIGVAQRDTAAWRLGLHRQPRPLAPRQSEWLPPLAATVALVVGVVNLASALTPNFGWRGHLLAHARFVPIFHALALPASAILIVASFYLLHRRRRAWELSFALMLVLVVFNLLKGFDVEEATLSLLAAALLWWGRPAFDALPREIHPRPSWLGALLALSIALAFSALLVEVAAPGEASTLAVLRELGDLMLWQRGPVHFPDELSRLPLAVGLLSLLGLLSGLWLLFRPLVLPRELPDADSRALAQALVKAHGHDTLAYFKLRRDKHYLFSTDGHAFLGYRVENGVLLVSGDPVGDEGAITELVATALSFAGRHGLAFGVVGASAPLLDLYRRTGLKAIYIGDEAVLELGSFSLEGRAIRKVRQSVSRLEKAGYKTVLSPYSALTESELTELEQISLAWLKGEDERGFSMAMDSLRGESQAESLLVVARDREGKARGFLHFVPAYGRQAYSLSFMRSDPDTPNGLMEYLVSAAAQSLREQGVEELSLNFAAFARFFRAPEGPGERLLARLFRLGERLFQIERLFHFNAKFFPRWDPRYLIFESVLSLPRLSLAVMWAEGQLPRPPIGLSRARPAERLGAEPRGHAL